MSNPDELRELGVRLLRLAEEEENTSQTTGADKIARTDSEGFVDPNHLRRLAEAVIRVRRLREVYFDPSLFADPAWDLLLDLYTHKTLGKRVAVKSACIAANVPDTTALRWISLLECGGLIDREEDVTDRRRALLSLTRKGVLAVTSYLLAMERHLRLTHPVPFMLVGTSAP